MRAFILAAGLGTRLRPLTERIPKPLVEVAGEPLVERAVRQLVAAGIRDIGINLFHLGEQIPAWLGDGSRYGARLRFFDERPHIRGTGGGLKLAEDFLRGDGDTFVLVNGDVWHGFDIRAVTASHPPGALTTLAVHRERRRPELHHLGCADDGRVVRINGTAAPAETIAFRAIYTGVAAFDVRVLEWLPPADKVSGLISHGVMPAMAAGERVCWTEPAGRWFDCGTQGELLRASSHALRLRAQRALKVGFTRPRSRVALAIA